MAAKWDYFVETLAARELRTEHLNMRAAEGWELVSTNVSAAGTVIYKLFWRR